MQDRLSKDEFDRRVEFFKKLLNSGVVFTPIYPLKDVNITTGQDFTADAQRAFEKARSEIKNEERS